MAYVSMISVLDSLLRLPRGRRVRRVGAVDRTVLLLAIRQGAQDLTFQIRETK